MDSIFIIGAGKAGVAMARALDKSGIEVTGLWTRSEKRKEQAAAMLKVPVHTSRWPEKMSAADVILFAVSDGAIAGIADELACDKALGPSQIVLHLCGALGTDVLDPLRGSVKAIGVLHPLVSLNFPDENAFPQQAGFGVDGDTEAVEAGRTIAHSLGGFSFDLPPDSLRGAYHAGAAVAGNFVTTLIWLANRLASSAGIEDAVALKALCTLAHTAVENAAAHGPGKSLTGPFSRGDVQTLKHHLEAVERTGKRSLAAYRAVGLLTVDLARKNGQTDEALLEEIEKLLAGASD